LWQQGLGMTYRSSDNNTWRTNFGRVNAQSAAAMAVPEPGSALCVLTAMAAWLRSRPRARG
jgi:hypothetical protein